MGEPETEMSVTGIVIAGLISSVFIALCVKVSLMTYEWLDEAHVEYKKEQREKDRATELIKNNRDEISLIKSSPEYKLYGQCPSKRMVIREEHLNGRDPGPCEYVIRKPVAPRNPNNLPLPNNGIALDWKSIMIWSEVVDGEVRQFASNPWSDERIAELQKEIDSANP